MDLQFLTQTNKVHKQYLDCQLWHDVVFLAEAEGERFTEVILMTSEAHRRDRAAEIAFAQGASVNNIESMINRLIPNLELEQFVEILEDRILVVINTPMINDRVANITTAALFRIAEFKKGIKIPLYGLLKEHSFSNI